MKLFRLLTGLGGGGVFSELYHCSPPWSLSLSKWVLYSGINKLNNEPTDVPALLVADRSAVKWQRKLCLPSCEERTELISFLWSLRGAGGGHRKSQPRKVFRGAADFVISHLNLKGDVLLIPSSWDGALQSPQVSPEVTAEWVERGWAELSW